jgi:starch phosphorylase
MYRYTTGEYSDALKALGYSLEDCAGVERNAGLGNGGLGRLAACFLVRLALFTTLFCK